MRRLNYRQCTACGTTFALPDKQRWCGFCERGFTAGLDEARKAVMSLPPAWEHPEHPEMQDIDKAKAIAAIDALRDVSND